MNKSSSKLGIDEIAPVFVVDNAPATLPKQHISSRFCFAKLSKSKLYSNNL